MIEKRMLPIPHYKKSSYEATQNSNFYFSRPPNFNNINKQSPDNQLTSIIETDNSTN